ncbi:hypothetical protein MKW98_013136 [Papaver atlanticum]|uniref:Nucleotide-diphospho-sugar transferase domain-containing protein n=1 Tax=Papaver atlanticum TaxID=357466 RepID=A0AAD4T8F5_9MAGN|nr:hypothetical protein MKW98_013136 [Papaver atlanticum]
MAVESNLIHQEKVLVIAEDYKTSFLVNQRWPGFGCPYSNSGHAVLIAPAPENQSAHKFESQGFFNFTPRRPRHLLHILELGYNVMYNDVDMVCDVYFTDDMTEIKPLDHSNALPPPGNKGRTYICSCMIFLRPTSGAKLVMKKLIEELQDERSKANDQSGFNWALNKTAGQEDYISRRKIQRFHDFGLWLVDEHSNESPLGKL